MGNPIKIVLIWLLSVISTNLFYGPLWSQNELILNKMCPILEEEPGIPEYEVEYEGKRVRLCCKMCIKMFNKNPQKWIDRLDPNGYPYLPQFYPKGENPNKENLVEEETLPETNPSETNPTKDLGGTAPTSPIENIPPKSVAGLEKMISFLGKFHPLLVHFPIAFILLAFFLELMQTFKRSRELAPATKTLLVFSLFSTLLAVPSGWCAAMYVEFPETISSYVEWHRWMGISIFVLLLILLTGISLFEEQKETKKGIWILRFILTINAILVGMTGHYGGILTFGPDHFLGFF